MNNSVLSAFLISCIVLSGCAETTKKAVHETTGDNADKFIQHGWDFPLGRSRAKIIEGLGNPVAVKAERAKPNINIMDPAVEIADEIYELTYDGLVVVLYRAAEEKKELLQQLTITSSKYKMKWDLHVGCTKHDVRTALGGPSEEQVDSYTYSRNQANGESSVQFSFEKDIVTRIDWSFSFE